MEFRRVLLRSISCAMTGTAIVPYDSDKLQRDKTRVEARFWDKLRGHIRRIPFVDEAVAEWYSAIDQNGRASSREGVGQAVYIQGVRGSCIKRTINKYSRQGRKRSSLKVL